MKQKKELNVQIGYRIKLAREKNNLTQEQFAEIVDKTPQFVSDLERGVCGISIETLKVICEKLHISSDSILFPGRGQCDDKIQALTDTFRLMNDSQFYILSEITTAFLCAYNLAESGKKQRAGDTP